MRRILGAIADADKGPEEGATAQVTIDRELLRYAIEATGEADAGRAVEAALAQMRRQAAGRGLLALVGKVEWVPGFLEEEMEDRIEPY